MPAHEQYPQLQLTQERTPKKALEILIIIEFEHAR